MITGISTYLNTASIDVKFENFKTGIVFYVIHATVPSSANIHLSNIVSQQIQKIECVLSPAGDNFKTPSSVIMDDIIKHMSIHSNSCAGNVRNPTNFL